MTSRESMYWPFVLSDDAGIRPAGKQDECFYCHQKVGQLHGSECVMIQKLVEYEVWGQEDEYTRHHVGTFIRRDPYFWDEDRCEWNKNQSSWCASNAIGHIQWNQDVFSQAIKERVESISCACGILSFRFRRVVEAGPLRGEN